MDIARQKLLQRLASQLIRVGVGLAQDLGMLDVIERRRRNLTVDDLQTYGFEGTLTNVDSPYARLRCRHFFP